MTTVRGFEVKFFEVCYYKLIVNYNKVCLFEACVQRPPMGPGKSYRCSEVVAI